MNIIAAAYQEILSRHGCSNLELLESSWQQEHRHYHDAIYLQGLLERISAQQQRGELSTEDYHSLVLAACFQGICYEPWSSDSLKRSVILLRQQGDGSAAVCKAQQLIRESAQRFPQDPLAQRLRALILEPLNQFSFPELLRWEQQIARERQYLDYRDYKVARIAELEELQRELPNNSSNLAYLIAYLGSHRPKIGLYAGSFRPFHLGHLNIVQKAEQIFDKIIIAQGRNPDKADRNPTADNPLFDNFLVSAPLRHRQCETFSGFLSNHLRLKEQDAEITFIRGLRNGDDLAYEVNQLRFISEMKPNLRVAFIHCDQEFEHISSSAIRNLERIQRGAALPYLPPRISTEV